MLFTDSFVHGGTERQLVAALRHLDRSRYDLRVGCLKRRGPFLSEVEALGIPVEEYPLRSLYGADTRAWSRKLTARLRAEQIDVVHAFDFYTNVFAVPAARRAGVPAVLASRRELAGDRSFAKRLAIRYACQRAHAIVANSRAAGASLTSLFGDAGEKVAVIHNGIDPAEFQPSRSPADVRAGLAIPADALLVGILSALRPEKQIDTFLRAAARVAQQLPAARFLLIGDGNERQKLEALARTLGIAGRVIFAGDRRDVPDLLAALDVFVLSSLTESFPNAVLEAMAASKPVVATRVGGTPELVEDGATGYLVPVGDDAAMAARVLELASDRALRRCMGAAGRVRAEREFTPAQMARKLDDLYQRLLVRRNPVARILQIGNYPPPVCGWSLHTQVVDRELAARGADSRVLDIGPGRTVGGRGCVPVRSGLDYAAKLLAYRLRGFTFQMHVNGDSWKGYTLALAAVLLGRWSGKPAVLTFHAGPSQIYFPRVRGFWRHAFALLFRSCGHIICNHEPVKKRIEAYGVAAARVHAIPAYSTQYGEEIPAPLPPQVEQFLAQHEPRLFSYSLFRPEFTMDVLFESFARLREKYPRAGLLLAGPKEVPAEAAEHMRRLGIAGAMLIPGNLPHAEFLTAVQRSDAFVRTHLRDGVCTSVLEALALGVPVVAAEDGLRPPSVVTYAPPDAAHLTAALESVMRDLPGARARVTAPAVANNVEREVALLLAAGATGRPHAPRKTGREEASAEKGHVRA
jgi:glycosyltransferase involved in cell wall biosynthesis